MAMLEGMKSRIDSLNKKLAESIGTDAEKHIEEEIDAFYHGELFDDGRSIESMVKKGDFESIEPRIRKFMDYIQNEYESKLHNKVASGIDDETVERIEIEDVKETLFLYVMRSEIEFYFSYSDKEIKRGYTEHLYKVPGDHMAYVDGKKFKHGDLGQNSVGASQSRVVSEDWINELISDARENLENTKKVLELGREMNVPESEMETAVEMENFLEERVEALEDIKSCFEEGDMEKAKEEYEALLKKIEEEEDSI
ncbi:MAG: hypothetical protein ABEK10_04160 [Candidatus Nanosalina sp.]